LSIWIWAEVAALALALMTLPTVLLDRQGRPLSAALWTLMLLLLPLVASARGGSSARSSPRSDAATENDKRAWTF
jgi:hypothetical protein